MLRGARRSPTAPASTTASRRGRRRTSWRRRRAPRPLRRPPARSGPCRWAARAPARSTCSARRTPRRPRAAAPWAASDRVLPGQRAGPALPAAADAAPALLAHQGRMREGFGVAAPRSCVSYALLWTEPQAGHGTRALLCLAAGKPLTRTHWVRRKGALPGRQLCRINCCGQPEVAAGVAAWV